MKIKLFKSTYILILFIISIVGYSKESKGKYSLEKIIEKTIIASPTIHLSIDNSYGNIVVVPWDKNEVQMKVTIKVSSNSKEGTEKRIEAINVKFRGDSQNYNATTQFSKFNSNYRNMNMSILYEVKVPRNSALSLKNNYGNIVTQDVIGPLRINLKYGRLDTGNLMNDNNELYTDYVSNARIETIKGGTINARYSGYSIQNADEIKINSAYTDWTINNANKLDISNNYGKVYITKVESINNSGNYMTLDIQELVKDLSSTMNYSTINMSKRSTVGDIHIRGNYNKMYIKTSENYGFIAKVNSKDVNFFGKYNILSTGSNSISFSSGNSSNSVDISSNYGKIEFRKI